jgi:hypothetical protein
VKLTEILLRHPEMMTEKERQSLGWRQSFLYAAMGYAAVSPFYCMYAYRLISKNPQYRPVALRKIFFVPCVSLLWLAYSAYDLSTTYEKLTGRYLGGITDYEITNFDALYSQVQNAQQQAFQTQQM